MKLAGTFAPFLALVLAASGFLASALVTSPSEKAPSVAQMFFIAFAIVATLYGLIGYVSVWTDGAEPRPGRRRAAPGSLALVIGWCLALAEVVLSGLLARLILETRTAGLTDDVSCGLLMGGMMLIAAALLTLYKKSALGSEVTSEDERSEVPW